MNKQPTPCLEDEAWVAIPLRPDQWELILMVLDHVSALASTQVADHSAITKLARAYITKQADQTRVAIRAALKEAGVSE